MEMIDLIKSWRSVNVAQISQRDVIGEGHDGIKVIIRPCNKKFINVDVCKCFSDFFISWLVQEGVTWKTGPFPLNFML